MGRLPLEELALTDVHIHVDSYPMYDPYVCKERGVTYGDLHHMWDLDRLEHHLTRDKIEEATCIFSDLASLDACQERVPDVKLHGWYWVRMPTALPEEVKADFPEWKGVFDEFETRGIVKQKPGLDYKEKDRIVKLSYQSRVYGLKVHPVQDFFEMTEENLGDVLHLARFMNLAILFHTDDRPETAHLSHPDLYEQVIRDNPDITFVIGHGGAFAHPRKVGENNPVARAYWSPKRKPFPVEWGIRRALDIALAYDNAYFDTSVSNNRIKAGIIGDALREHPELAQSIVLGTDFPLGFGASASGQLAALAEHGKVGEEVLRAIAATRLPGRWERDTLIGEGTSPE